MSDGILGVLSLEDIQEAIADTRTRGAYYEDAKNFFESGELAFDFSEKYPGKRPESLRNSVDQNVKKLKAESNGSCPEWQIVYMPVDDKKHVVLINMDTYRLETQTNEA